MNSLKALRRSSSSWSVATLIWRIIFWFTCFAATDGFNQLGRFDWTIQSGFDVNEYGRNYNGFIKYNITY